MNLSRLAKIDLNLLVALHILIEEGSVSKAASKLSITQPAMSKTLGRLRETFDDPLLVEARRKVQKQLQREEERLRKRDKAPFPLRRPRLVDNDESCVEEGLLSS